MRDVCSRSRVFVLCIAGSLLGAGLATTAIAGPVSGSLTIPSEYRPPEVEGARPDHYWEEWNGFLDPRPRRLDAPRELSVVLTGQGDGPSNDFAFVGGDLQPATLVARAGADVRIENTDGCTHEIFSDDIEGLTPLSTAPGNARSFAAPAPGHYTIRDRLYAHVTAHLHVLPDLVARGSIDSGGRYSFADVEPGTYTLKVFFGERELASQSVEVGGGALTVDPIALNLSAE
jgi:hypothetical protein